MFRINKDTSQVISKLVKYIITIKIMECKALNRIFIVSSVSLFDLYEYLINT
uniref:Uncharacterized protein n=1 Tax=Inkyuleea mariana TaxID=123988 RepID=A0A4D6X748_9FLOR|nr:hypothetical protein [Inkyuleea mariana]